MRALFSCVILPTDTRVVAFSKKVMLIGCAMGLFTVGVALASRNTKGGQLGLISAFLMVTVCLVQVLQLCVERKIRVGLIEIVLYVTCLAILQSDLVTTVKSSQERAWPYIVPVLDLCLVCRLPSRVSGVILSTLAFWFLLLAMESVYKFGFYNLSFLPSQAARRDAIACDGDLPCRVEFLDAIIAPVNQITIILLDFYFTRRFANDLHREHDKMNKVIVAAEDIATSLSHFDLEAAEAIISTASLPPQLYDAYQKSLENLHMYRPYIPDALFHSMHCKIPEPAKNVAIPGIHSQKAAVVFTDIQGSTATWEACPEGMKEGLEVHNKAVRACIAEHNGYEVKTIGDAFMVAFECASDAVWFGLSVQESLVNSAWPEELLMLSHCARNDEGPWCGLRVRVGVHCGDVSVQLNNLTGRYDYFGNTVNKAARMEAACVGGAVAVTPEVMEAAGSLDLVTVIPMGQTELKGVSGSINPFLLLPRSLLGRKSFVEQQLLLNREDRKLIIETTVDDATPRSSLSTLDLAMGRLKVRSATIGHVEMTLQNYEADTASVLINAGLAKIVTCTERSHGAVVSLQGNRVAVCWNGPKPCTTHVENSLVFVKILGSATEIGRGESSSHMGLSTGNLLYGTVGGRNQKFMTVLGGSTLASSVLCSSAVVKDALCFYASPYEIDEVDGLCVTSVGTHDAMGASLFLYLVTLDHFLCREY